MRRLADAGRVQDFMRRLGERADASGLVYFTGAADRLAVDDD